MDWDEKIRSRLNELRRSLLGLQVGVGLWRSLASGAALLLLAGLLELSFHFDTPIRTPLFWATLLAAVFAWGWWVIRPLLVYLIKPAKAEELALLWGRSIAGVNDRLLNAIQVYEQRHRETTSPELAELALETIARELQGASFAGVLDRAATKRAQKWALGVVLTWTLALLISPGGLADALYRFWQPGRDFSPPPAFSLALENPPALGIRNEPLKIKVVGSGKIPRGVNLNVRENGLDPVNYQVEFDSSGRAEHILPDIQNDLRIFAYWENIFSDTAFIPVKSRPFIRDLQVRWFPPAYSKLPSGAATQKRGDVFALKGSRVRIALQADRNLDKAELFLFSDDHPAQPRKLNMQVQGKEASAEFSLLESGHYNIILKDQDGIKSAAPVDYSLWPILDEMPTVEIIYPPPDAELTESLIIPLKIRAQDDFAISRIRLGFKLLKGGVSDDSTSRLKYHWEKLPFTDIGEGSFLSDYLWDLNPLNLLPGDEILYKVDALDNDRISGPKRVESALQRLRFPTLEEIFARMEEGHSDQVQNAQEAVERSRSLKEELDALREELKRNPDLPWEERKKVEDMVKKQEEMAHEVTEMSERLQQLIQKMDDNRLLSSETLQKYQELQKLLSEVMTPELLQALQKLREALQKQDPEALRRAVEEFSLNQEEFLEKMEKTLNILKQLRAEMKLDELSKRAQQLLEKQQEINRALDDSSQQGAKPQEAKAEKNLQNEMEAFEREFQKAQEMLAASPHNPEETMAEAQQILDENQFPQAMNQMSQNLQQGENAAAQQQGSRIQSGLAQLADKLKRAKQEFVDAAKSELAEALKKIAYDLLLLSYQQEDLLNVSSTLDKASPRFRSLAQKQLALKKHLEKTAAELFELSKQSFFITPQMGTAIDQAFKGMEQALAGYTARNPRSVSRQQQNAMGGVNRAIMEIGNSLNKLSASSSSTGFSEMMEQLGKMAGQQGEINQGTMSLLPGGNNPGGFTLEQQAAMSRLAAEQEALRRELESLNQSSQEISKMMGRLGELGKEMQEVVDDLKNRQVDERTLKRQQRILTRLLDAQRSVREREYRRERLSRTAKGPYFNPAPEEFDPSASSKSDEIREKLLKALKEGYTRDYQQLIRAYFEALAREN